MPITVLNIDGLLLIVLNRSIIVKLVTSKEERVNSIKIIIYNIG